MLASLVLGVGSFLVGMIVGVVLRDALEIYATGKGFIVSSSRRITAKAVRSRTFGVALVAAALVANAVVGFLLIVTRADLEEAARDRDRDLACQERYNRAQGEALTDRDANLRAAGDSEIVLWTEYLRLFELADRIAREDPERLEELQRDFAADVRAHRSELIAVQETRAATPFPDPDLCRERMTP